MPRDRVKEQSKESPDNLKKGLKLLLGQLYLAGESPLVARSLPVYCGQGISGDDMILEAFAGLVDRVHEDCGGSSEGLELLAGWVQHYLEEAEQQFFLAQSSGATTQASVLDKKVVALGAMQLLIDARFGS
jgi:hypothetical protein